MILPICHVDLESKLDSFGVLFHNYAKLFKLFEMFPVQKVFPRLPLRNQKRLVKYRLYFTMIGITPHTFLTKRTLIVKSKSCSLYSIARVKDTVLQAHEYFIVSVGLIKCVTLNPICCYNT